MRLPHQFRTPPSSWSTSQALTTLIASGQGEPSAIIYHPRIGRYFFIDDGNPVGRVVHMDTSGGDIKNVNIIDDSGRDLEGLCYADVDSDWLFVLEESRREIYEVSITAILAAANGDNITPRRTWSITAVPISGGNGPEGMCFVPIDGHDEGGVFWVGTQTDGKVYILELKIETSISDTTVTHLTGSPYNSPIGPPYAATDLADLYCDHESGYVFWLYDANNRIAVTKSDGTYVTDFAEPAAGGTKAYEGLSLGPNGVLALANDAGTVETIPFQSLLYGPLKNTPNHYLAMLGAM